MRWSDLRQSSNVEDRRGLGGPILAGGGGLGVLLLALVIYLCGGDPGQLLQNAPTGREVDVAGSSQRGPVSDDENSKFARAILGSLEDTWRQILPQQAHVSFHAPKLVLFTNK